MTITDNIIEINTFSLVKNFLSSIQDAKNSLYFNSTDGLDLYFTSKAFLGVIFSTNLSISSNDAGDP